MPRHFSADELDCLQRLRELFLSLEDWAGDPGEYWESRAELALYDETFAQRIGWKWDAVLGELGRRGRFPLGSAMLDWGCGTGIAVRRTLAARAGVAGLEGVRVSLFDRSKLARTFAAERLAAEFPSLEVATELPERVDLLLVSHVLGELDADELEELATLVERAAAVVWVEPGSRSTSRRLGELRERFRSTHDVLAPCTHQAACGALAGDDAWCHSFARPPREVFTTGPWSEFGRELGIDLRSLPYSFLVLGPRGACDLAGPAARLIGRPRLSRGRAELAVCDAEGVRTLDFLQRTDKGLFKRLADVAGEPWLFDARIEGRRLASIAPRDA